jgi:hypothetical protein
MKDILSDFEKYGEFEEEDFEHFRTRLKVALKRNELPEIVKIEENYVIVEVDDLRVELKNGEIILSIIRQ